MGLPDKSEQRVFWTGAASRKVYALHPKAVGESFAPPDLTPPDIRDDGIALVSICGPLEHHRNWMFDSYDEILCRIEEALKAEETKALVMCFDSPGGDAAGAMEAHRKIRRLRKKYDKPIYSYANEAAYSAAYALASAADEIWLPDTGGVGSVGVIAAVMDRTRANEMMGVNIQLITTGKRKADSHPDRPLTKDIVDRMQERVDYLGDIFFNVVAKAREMTPDKVRALEAGVFHGFVAMKKGLADNVAGWDKFLSLIRDQIGASGDAGRVAVKSGTSSGHEAKMASKKLLSLTKARDEAMSAVASAKTEVERKKLCAAYEAAIVALSEYKAKHSSEEEEEEDVKHKSSKAKHSSEEEEEEDRYEDEEDDEDEEEEEEDSDGGDTDSSMSSTSDSTDGEDMKAFFSAKTGLYTPARLVRLVSQVTGQKNIKEMFGALDGMGIRMKAVSKQEKRIAKLEGESRKSRVDKMLSQAKRDGKISRAQVEGLRAKGMEDPKFLKGFLATLPKIVRTVEDGPQLPRMDANGNILGAPSTNDQQKIMELAMTGLSGAERDKAVADLAERRAKKNGSTGRY